MKKKKSNVKRSKSFEWNQDEENKIFFDWQLITNGNGNGNGNSFQSLDRQKQRDYNFGGEFTETVQG